MAADLGNVQAQTLKDLVGRLRSAGVNRLSQLVPLIEEGPEALLRSAFPDSVQLDPGLVDCIACFFEKLPGLAEMERRLALHASVPRSWADEGNSDEKDGSSSENSDSDSPASEETPPEQAPPEATRPRQDGAAGADLARLGLELFVHTGARHRTLHAARRDDAGSAARLVCGLLKSRARQAEDVCDVHYDIVCLRCLRNAEL